MEQALELRKRLIQNTLNSHVFITSGHSIANIQDGNIISPDILQFVLTDDNMAKYFMSVFTHMSADYDNSYEQLEFGGDLGANLFTYRKILMVMPVLTPKEANNMVAHYKSNEIYAKALRDSIPNVKDLILTASHVEKSEKIYADVFEALIMAVFITCNAAVPGMG